MIISLVAAMDTKRGIGNVNDLPWRGKVPADMKHFRELTTGHPIIMGRKTYESMGRALPNRRNVVISRTADFTAPDVEVFSSPSDALVALNADNADEVFIIGGSQIFAEFLPLAHRMHLTYIEGDFEADAHFPVFEEHEWIESDNISVPEDDKNQYSMRFVVLDRIL